MDNIRLDVQIREEIENLMLIAEGYVESKAAAHTIERGVFKQLLVLGLSLLSYIFKQRISQITAQGVPKKDGIALRNKGLEICQYLSLFGLLTIERPPA
jgi:putative IMPACT (imprinted ancient) family translation regulator